MGYFDGFVALSLTKDDSGNTLYCPFGGRGSCYVVNSEENRAKVRKFYKIFIIAVIVSAVFIQNVMGLWYSLALLPIFMAYYYFAAKKLVKDFPKSVEKYQSSATHFERLKTAAIAYGLPVLISGQIISLVFVAVGIWMIQSGRDPQMGLAAIGFFGFCGVVDGYMIFTNLKNK